MKYSKYIFLCLLTIGVLSSCELDPIDNPNGPTLGSLENDATEGDLLLLASGVEASMRIDMVFYYQTVSIVGREYYDLNGTDPRYTGELLGAGDGNNELDNNGFLTTRSFAARHRSIRNAHLLLNAISNTSASLTDEEKNGYKGFAKIVQAYQMLLVLNRQYQNGIILDNQDPDNLGPYVSYTEGLAGLTSLLDDAISDLNAAGDDLHFNLSSGFSGFNSPEGLAQVANALKARILMYANNKAGALTALAASFYDLSGNMDMGPSHAFGTAGNDLRNPLFYIPGTDLYMAQSSFITDAEAGDDRLSKVSQLSEPAILDGLSEDYQVQIYSSNVDPVALIRNEELVLLFAEANIGADNNQAVNALNVVRTFHGLDAYSGGTDDASLTDEMLKQRRYSLFGEGHRWIDMRRYNRLDQLPLDRAGDQVFTQFPRPVTEGN